MSVERPFQDGFDPGEIDLRERFAVLSRRRGVIYTALLIVLIATVIFTVAETPQYRAETTLQIEPDTPKILNFEDMFQVDATTDSFYQTQYWLIEGPDLAARVVNQQGLFAGSEENPGLFGSFVSAAKSLPGTAVALARSMFSDGEEGAGSDAPTEEEVRQTQRLDKFGKRLEVNPIRNTRLVSISWRSPSPTKAAEVTRAIAAAYIEMNLEAKFATTRNANQFLAREIVKLQAEIAEAEGELLRYGSARNILSDSERQDVVSQSLMQLNRELTTARTERVQEQATWDSLRAADPTSLPEVRANRLVVGLQEDLADLRRRHADLLRRFTEEWPQVQSVAAQIDDLDTRIAAEERSIHSAVVRQARSAYQAALDREQQIQTLLDESTGDATQLNQSLIAYRGLQTAIQSKTSMLESLLGRQSETGVSARLQGQQMSNIRVVAEASVPLKPSSPSWRLNLLVGLMLGLVTGVGIAFTQEHFDNTLTSPGEVERRLGIPNLAVVPAVASAVGGYGYGLESSGLGPNTATETVVRDHPRSSLAEAYRGLRASVLLSQAGQPPKVLLVTSAQPGEGKTTSAVNLAIALAQAGKTTLLIDADLRRPRLHEILDLNGRMGLVTYLTGAATIERVIHETQVTNLWAMPCGPLPPNPAELLGSSELRILMEQLREGFDAVVIDSPPVLPVVDAVELAALADGVLLVVGGGQTPHPLVEQAVRKLHDVQANVLGAVLNNVDISTRAYYGPRKRSESAPGATRGNLDRAATSDKRAEAAR